MKRERTSMRIAIKLLIGGVSQRLFAVVIQTARCYCHAYVGLGTQNQIDSERK